MEKFRKTVYIILCVIVILLVICSLLSIFRNTESRYLKMLDFPRIQFFVASLLALILLAITTRNWRWWDFFLVTGLAGGIFVNGFYLVNYTSLVPPEVPSANAIKPTDASFSILVVNVKMTNRNASALINLIKNKKPDIVLAMEIDQWWDEKLAPVEKGYSYVQKTINEVAYGMVLYSKFPLSQTSVNYLHNKNVPSFETKVSLSNGKQFSLHCVHPVPPTHFEEFPDNAGQHEIAMQKLGEKINAQNTPVVVAGDLNDVVWSYVDALTGTQNKLFDVRKGRGFYNSYNAENIFKRWPLDHVFVTSEFRLQILERLQKIGSDHFPIYVKLVL